MTVADETPGTPDPGAGDWELFPQGDRFDHDPGARTYPSGNTRLSTVSLTILVEGNLARGRGSAVPWVALVQSRTSGRICLEPTVEADPHRLPLTLIPGRRSGTLTLHRLLLLKGIQIPSGHSMYIPCGRLELPDGPALELKLDQRRFKAMSSSRQAPAADPPPQQPAEEAPPGPPEST